MNYRRGSGHWYALTRWFLMIAYVFYLWSTKPKYKSILFLAVFSFLAYFLGSKGFILNFFIVFVFYWHYLVEPIKNKTLVLYGVFIFLFFLFLQLFQGTAKSLVDTIKYFTYFDSTAHFLSLFDSVGFQHGHAMIGQLWDTVPRTLVPNKPIVYGQYIVHETLNPGQLAKGRATGVLVWTRYYLDFGTFGVFGAAFLAGITNKIVFDYFLLYKTNPFIFMIMVQVGVIKIFNYATFPIFLILLLSFSKFFRMTGTFPKIIFLNDRHFNLIR